MWFLHWTLLLSIESAAKCFSRSFSAEAWIGLPAGISAAYFHGLSESLSPTGNSDIKSSSWSRTSPTWLQVACYHHSDDHRCRGHVYGVAVFRSAIGPPFHFNSADGSQLTSKSVSLYDLLLGPKYWSPDERRGKITGGRSLLTFQSIVANQILGPKIRDSLA